MAPAVKRLRLLQKWLLARHQWKLLLMRKAMRKLQRKWLVAWHHRKGPLVQVKNGCAPSVEAAADASCRKVKIQRQRGPRKCLVLTDQRGTAGKDPEGRRRAQSGSKYPD